MRPCGCISGFGLPGKGVRHEILIQQREEHKGLPRVYLGGLWEFGGSIINSWDTSQDY